MPALPVVPNVLRVDILWQDNADNNVSSRLFFEYTGDAPSGGACAALAGDLSTSVISHAGMWSTETAFTGVVITDLSSDDGGRGSTASLTEGTRAGMQLPGGTAVVVSYAINRRYRGGKPRNYLPWGVANDLSGRQQWATSFLTDVGSAVTTLTSDFSGMSEDGTTVGDHVNVSYYQGFTVEGGTGGKRAKNVSTPRATPLVNAITGNTVVSYPGSQRRRNRT